MRLKAASASDFKPSLSVSIPEGAIEGANGRGGRRGIGAFQYPKVRLKGAGSNGGAGSLKFQYPKVRLKDEFFMSSSTSLVCFNTRRCD